MHLSPISRHLELVSWGEARNKGEKWNVVIIFLPFLKVERCCYFNAMYFLFSFYSLGVLMMRSIRRSSNQCTSEQSQCVTSPLGQQPTPGHAQTPTRHKHSPPQSTPGTHVMLKHPISFPQSPHMPQPRPCGDSCKHEVSLCCSYKPLSISHPLHLKGNLP